MSAFTPYKMVKDSDTPVPREGRETYGQLNTIIPISTALPISHYSFLNSFSCNYTNIFNVPFAIPMLANNSPMNNNKTKEDERKNTKRAKLGFRVDDLLQKVEKRVKSQETVLKTLTPTIDHQVEVSEQAIDFRTNENISRSMQNTKHEDEDTKLKFFQDLNLSIQEHALKIENIVTNVGGSKKGYLCLYCGKYYSRKYGLKIHVRTHTGYKPLACKFCGRLFSDPSNLNKHIRLHEDESSKYKCPFCAKKLIRKRDFEKHVQSRHSCS